MSWKIPRMDEIEVFCTEQGEIGIKQEGTMGGDDAIVIIARDRLSSLIDFLELAAREIDEQGADS